MTHTTKTSWNEGLHFTTTLDNQNVEFDATAIIGNDFKGVSPKKILLSSLAGCTGMDVASLLKKYKVPFSDFNLTVSGELTDSHPKYYRSIHITYDIKTEAKYRDKVEEAVRLSREQYCGVQAMLRQAADITYEINLYLDRHGKETPITTLYRGNCQTKNSDGRRCLEQPGSGEGFTCLYGR